MCDSKRRLQEGDKFGRLQVIGFSEMRNGKSLYEFVCDCGKVCTKIGANVKSGVTKSCGCLKTERLRETKTIHGNSGTRLHQCWKSMKARAKNRNGCEVEKAWEDFSNFEEWALCNGYEDTLVLCRNGDTGDYCPDNVRWDTKASNSREATLCMWEVTTPDGKVELVGNMVTYCKDRGLDSHAMRSISRGVIKTHKSYSNVKKLQPKKDPFVG